MKSRRKDNRIVRAVRKSLLPAFVVASFGAYALENHANAGATASVVEPTPAPLVAMAPSAAPAAPGSPAAAPSAAPSAVPSAAPTATAAPTAAPAATATARSSSGYTDGTYTGPVVDIRWGYVQVQATVQNGQIVDVQFLQYPNERRTSARINATANPLLQQEAIQAQSANVNLITGATLTSQGFEQSLQIALTQAQG